MTQSTPLLTGLSGVLLLGSMHGCVNSYSPYGSSPGYPGQPYPGQVYPGQVYPGQTYPGATNFGQPLPPGSTGFPQGSVIPGPVPDPLNSAPSWGSGSTSAPTPSNPPSNTYDNSGSTFQQPTGGVFNYPDPSFNPDGFQTNAPRPNETTMRPLFTQEIQPSGYQTSTSPVNPDDQYYRPIDSANPVAPTQPTPVTVKSTTTIFPATQPEPASAPANQPQPLFPMDTPTPIPTPAPTSQPAPASIDEFWPQTSSQPTSPNLDPRVYAYDGRFQWLQGTLKFDQSQQSWQINYSLRPDDADPLGGHVTLGQSDQLRGYKTGDVIRVQGQLDRQAIDHEGKPIYRIQHLSKIASPS